MITCKSLPIFVKVFKEMSLKEGNKTVEDLSVAGLPERGFYTPIPQ